MSTPPRRPPETAQDALAELVALKYTGEPDRALALVPAALALAERTGEESVALLIRGEAVCDLLELGLNRRAAEDGAALLADVRRLGPPRLLVAIGAIVATAWAHLDDVNRATAALADAIVAAETLSLDTVYEVGSVHNVGLAAMHFGLYPTAEPLLARAAGALAADVPVERAIPLVGNHIACHENWGVALAQEGDEAGGAAHLRRALDATLGLLDRGAPGIMRDFLAVDAAYLEARLGRPADAAARLARVDGASVDAQASVHQLMIARLARAAVAAGTDRPAEALAEAGEGARLAGRDADRLWEAEAHTMLAAAYRRLGDDDAAAMAEDRARTLADAFRWNVRLYGAGLDAARRRGVSAAD